MNPEPRWKNVSTYLLGSVFGVLLVTSNGLLLPAPRQRGRTCGYSNRLPGRLRRRQIHPCRLPAAARPSHHLRRHLPPRIRQRFHARRARRRMAQTLEPGLSVGETPKEEHRVFSTDDKFRLSSTRRLRIAPPWPGRIPGRSTDPQAQPACSRSIPPPQSRP